MRYSFTYSMAIGLACLVSGAALADETFVKLGGLAIFSSLSYEPTERDFSGEQIVVVPSGDGEKLLWRTANGVFDPPLLLDVVKQGGLFKVKHPESGEWTFQVKGTFLEGVSSKGVKIRLKQVPLK